MPIRQLRLSSDICHPCGPRPLLDGRELYQHTRAMVGRRPLSFSSLDQVMPEVRFLLTGHTTVGRWSLAQICHHLEVAIRLSMEGVPVKASWLKRRVLGAVVLRVALWSQWMPEGVKIPALYLPQPGLDAVGESEALAAAIERFLSFTGRFDEHPLLGPLTPDQWDRFHCLHCAHHLSFVVPQ